MNSDIQFLKDLQKELLTQDTDIQAAPRFWVIKDYRTVPANEEYDDGFEQYFYNDGDFVEFKDFDDLKEFIEDDYDEDEEIEAELQDILDDPEKDMERLWEYVEDNLNSDGYFNKAWGKEESFIVPNTMFISKTDAKKHLELNHYHYSSKAHTYAMTAWRSPKVERLWNILETFDWDSIDQDSDCIEESIGR